MSERPNQFLMKDAGLFEKMSHPDYVVNDADKKVLREQAEKRGIRLKGAYWVSESQDRQIEESIFGGGKDNIKVEVFDVE